MGQMIWGWYVTYFHPNPFQAFVALLVVANATRPWKWLIEYIPKGAAMLFQKVRQARKIIKIPQRRPSLSPIRFAMKWVGLCAAAWILSLTFNVLQTASTISRMTLSDRSFLVWAYMGKHHVQGNVPSLALITAQADRPFKVPEILKSPLIVDTYQALVRDGFIKDYILETTANGSTPNLIIEITPRGERVAQYLMHSDKTQRPPSY